MTNYDEKKANARLVNRINQFQKNIVDEREGMGGSRRPVKPTCDSARAGPSALSPISVSIATDDLRGIRWGRRTSGGNRGAIGGLEEESTASLIVVSSRARRCPVGLFFFLSLSPSLPFSSSPPPPLLYPLLHWSWYRTCCVKYETAHRLPRDTRMCTRARVLFA